MKSLPQNQNHNKLESLDDKASLSSLQISNIAGAVAFLSSIRDNNSNKDQIITASAMIQKQYPTLTLSELKEIIINGIMQKYNDSERPHYNDIPTLMFWLKQYKKQKNTPPAGLM